MSETVTSHRRGKTFPPPATTRAKRLRTDWTPEMDARLRRLAATPRTWPQVAEAMGVGEQGVKARAARLGLRKTRGGARRAWSAQEDARILALYGAGLSGERVAMELGRSRHAVAERLSRLRACAAGAPAGDRAARARALRVERAEAAAARAAQRERQVLPDAAAAHLADLRRHHAPDCGELTIAPDGAPRRIFAGSVGSPGSPSAMCAEM